MYKILLRSPIVIAVAIAFLITAPSPAHADDESRIKVMTQNLYIGANIFKLLDATTAQEVPAVAAGVFADILATDFYQRADSIADTIAKKRPHLIGLQEVTLLRTQCPTDIPSTPNAEDVLIDFLEVLLNALDARGADYEVVASIENVDAALPVSNSPVLLPDCQAPIFVARVTDHDVTLKRSDVTATEVFQNRYEATLPVPIGGGAAVIPFYRGFTVVDAEVKGQSYRFVNTHLEPSGNPFSNFFQFAQADELTQTLNALTGAFGDKALFVAGDFNSSPEAFRSDCAFLPDPTVIPDGCPTPYALMVGDGYADAWNLREDSWKPGFTCCQSPLLDNQKSELDRRIDHIWYRDSLTGPALEIDEVKAKVVGARKKDKTINGLWPSDHAGVIAKFVFEDEDDDSDSDD